MFDVHEKVRRKITLSNGNYKARADLYRRHVEFKEDGNGSTEAWVICKSGTPKLQSWSASPYKVLKKSGSEGPSIYIGHHEEENSEVQDLKLLSIPKVWEHIEDILEDQIISN